MVHFDISRNAPSWQLAPYNSVIHLRSLDSNKQAGPSWQRPGFKGATRALKNLQNAEGQGVPFLPVKSRTRQNNTLNPEPQVFLEWLSFNWVEYFAKTQNSECQHHHLQAGHQAQHGGVRHLGTNFGKNGTLMGGKTKNGRTKGKERQRQVHAPHSLRKLLAWARTSTLSKSTCVLIPSCIADFFFTEF